MKTRKRQIEKEEAEKYATSSGLLYFECSAKTGQGVQEAFVAVMKKIPCSERDQIDREDEIILGNKDNRENNEGGMGCGNC